VPVRSRLASTERACTVYRRNVRRKFDRKVRGILGFPTDNLRRNVRDASWQERWPIQCLSRMIFAAVFSLDRFESNTMVLGKKAVVSGATSGIGLCIATTLARHGADVVINGFGDVDRALKHFQNSPSNVLYHAADLRNPSEIEALMDFALSKLGGIDILVNNAGIQHVSPIESFPTEQWDAILAINLSAAFHTMRLAIPSMKSSNWGRIINIASVHGLVASVNKSAYVASKHGLVGLTKVAALELATTSITANAICPGWVRTDLVQKQIDARAKMEAVSTEQAAQRLLAEKQPSLQFTTPEQIAELVLFLCSPAADNIRGSTFNLDGGWTAQ